MVDEEVAEQLLKKLTGGEVSLEKLRTTQYTCYDEGILIKFGPRSALFLAEKKLKKLGTNDKEFAFWMSSKGATSGSVR